MRLITIELEGYRRFEQRAKISCDGKLTALVGPNEAGKSTILDAIERLDDEQPISLLERTRGTSPADNAVAITALWMIEPADLKEIDILAGSQTPRWLIVEKTFAGARVLTLKPTMTRDRSPRQRLIKQIEKVKDKPWFVTLNEDEESVFELSSLDEVIAGLPDERPTVAPTTIQRLRGVADQIDERAEDAPGYAKNLAAQLRAVADHEAADHPTDVAKRVLFRRTPDFLRFRPEERQLESFYDLNDVIANPRPALDNLAKLARLNLPELCDAIAADDRGFVADLRQNTNAELKRRIGEAWDQSTVEPSFDNDDYVLRILVRTGQGGLHDIAQRSDGLRSFIALVAFTTEQARDLPPVLLIDQAEIHLHYDAQADLVQMLGHQQQAPQVIYTTHPAGCLPQDLGTGVRIVVADEEAGRSSVDNWPWEAEGGFGPILEWAPARWHLFRRVARS
jgi:predicted ATPase